MDITSLKEQKKNRKVEWHTLPGTTVEFQLRYLLPLDLDKIGKSRDLYKKTNGKMNWKLYFEKVLIETVVDWKNISLGEEPYPCTDENKIELDGMLPQFRELWKKAAGLSRTDEDIDESEEDDDEMGN